MPGNSMTFPLRMAATADSEANVTIKKLIVDDEQFLSLGDENGSFVIHDKTQLDALIAGLVFARDNIGWGDDE